MYSLAWWTIWHMNYAYVLCFGVFLVNMLCNNQFTWSSKLLSWNLSPHTITLTSVELAAITFTAWPMHREIPRSKLYHTSHYNDVIMNTMASQITSQRKHQSSASLTSSWEIVIYCFQYRVLFDYDLSIIYHRTEWGVTPHVTYSAIIKFSVILT